MLKGSASRIRLPVTVDILGRIHQALMDSSHPEKGVIWAIACSAFFGFFRLGELLLTSSTSYDPATCLSWGDVAVDDRSNPTMVQFHLKKLKCDQFGKGADVIVGRTYVSICPVTAILNFIAGRTDRPGTFFLLSSGAPATKGWFTRHIRELLGAMGLPQDQYAGHSFRIGAATTAAMKGVEDSTIQALGRWHSATFLLYVRSPKERLASLSRVMAAPTPSRTAATLSAVA